MARTAKKRAPSPIESTVGKRVQINIRLPASLKDWIERLAELDQRTTNNWVERALADACERTARAMGRAEREAREGTGGE